MNSIHISKLIISGVTANLFAVSDFGMTMLWISIIFLVAFLIIAIALIFFFRAEKKSSKQTTQEQTVQTYTVHTTETQQPAVYNASHVTYTPINTQPQALPMASAMPPPASPASTASGGLPRVPYLGTSPAPASHNYQLSSALPPPAKPSQAKLATVHTEKLKSGSSQPESTHSKVTTVDLPTVKTAPQSNGRYTESYPRKGGFGGVKNNTTKEDNAKEEQTILDS